MARSMLLRAATAVLAATALLTAGAQPGRAATIFTLTGHGWGHGIGMSQYGALGDAQHGWTYGRILTHYYSGTRIAALQSPTLERVLLASGRTSIDLGAASRLTVVDEGGTQTVTLAAGDYRVEPGSSGHLRVVNRANGAIAVRNIVGPARIVPGSQALRIDSSAGIGWAHDHWHGSLRVIRSGATVSLIDLVPLEYYLRGVVPSEMPASWPAAALRAQAVAARSYAVATRNPARTFDAYADTRSQVYGPIEHEAATSTAAVTATTRQAVWYGGSVAVAFFSSSSGGVTASEQAAWGTSSGQPYLVPVPDPYDGANGQNPNHTWRAKAYSPGGLAAAVGASHDVSSVDLRIDGPSQRVLDADIHTRAGTLTLTGPSIQARMGLRSNYFRLVGLSLNAPAGVVAGRTLTLTGRAWPKPSGGVALLRRGSPTGTWTVLVPKLTLAADGTFSLRLKPLVNRQFRLRTRSGAISPTPFVHVFPALTLTRAAGAFRASIYPVISGASLHLQRHTTAGWRLVATATTGRRGRAQFSAPVSAGVWRVGFGGDAHHAASHSPAVTIPAVAAIWHG
jgi:stage II sporulation protein D